MLQLEQHLRLLTAPVTTIGFLHDVTMKEIQLLVSLLLPGPAPRHKLFIYFNRNLSPKTFKENSSEYVSEYLNCCSIMLRIEAMAL